MRTQGPAIADALPPDAAVRAGPTGGSGLAGLVLKNKHRRALFFYIKRWWVRRWMEVDDEEVAAGDAMGSRTGSEGFGDFDIIGNPDEFDVTEYLDSLVDEKDVESWIAAVEVVKASIIYVQGQIKVKEVEINPVSDKKQKINNDGPAARVGGGAVTPEEEEINKLTRCLNNLIELRDKPIDEWNNTMITNLNRDEIILNYGMVKPKMTTCDLRLVDVHTKLKEFTMNAGQRVVSWLKAKKLIESVIRYWQYTTDVALHPNRTSYLKDIQELYATSLSDWTKEKIEKLREIGSLGNVPPYAQYSDAERGCLIPNGFLGDFDSTPAQIGFGTYLSDYIKKMEGEDPYKKILMIRGWERIFSLKKKNEGGNIILLDSNGTIGVSTLTELLRGVINFNKMLTVNITQDVVDTLNQHIPYHQEITEHPVLDYIKEFLKTGALVDQKAQSTRKKKISALKEVFSVNAHYPFPISIRHDKNLSLFVGDMGLAKDTFQLAIKSNFAPILKCGCNVGYVDIMVGDFMQNIVAGRVEYVLIGTLFRKIAYFRYSDAFNDSVIRDILHDFYGKLVSYKNDNVTKLRAGHDLNGILFMAGLELLKPFTEKKNKLDLNETDKKNLIEGCFLINTFSSMYKFQYEDIPTPYKEYLGIFFDKIKPNAPPVNGRAESATISLFATFQTMVGFIRLREGRFKKAVSKGNEYLGDKHDRKAFVRYDRKDIKAVKENLPRDFLIPLLNTVGDQGATHVLIGGLACMLRYNEAYKVMPSKTTHWLEQRKVPS